MHHRWDVIVAGGGPAGSTAARQLARAGARTLLLEKARHPRYKACGGGVPARAVALLDRSIAPVTEDVVQGIEVSHLGERRFVKRSTDPLAYMVMRDRFDALLLEWAGEAGAEVREGEAVQDVETGSGGVRVSTDRDVHEATVVLGADGAAGRVARASGLGSGLAKSAAWELEVAAHETALRRWNGLVNVDVGYRPWGYGWVFPKAERLSIGLVLAPGRGRRIREQAQRYIAALGLAGAEVQEARGHPIRYRRRRERVAAGPVLLLGDAAGLADEFTAEGISYAIESARLAATAALAALGGAGEAAEKYTRAIDRMIQPELNAARAISRMYYWCVTTWPWLALGTSKRVAYLWHALFRVMQGRSTYQAELQRIPGLALSARML